LTCQKFYWRVRWWNASGQVSPYSEIAIFGTGFMGNSKFRANWISMNNPESYVGQTDNGAPQPGRTPGYSVQSHLSPKRINWQS
jgi:alpha-L-rhamnosidase